MTQCIQEEKKYYIFTICPCPAQEPLAWGSWNLQFCQTLPWSSLLYDPYPSVYKKRKRKNKFSINDLYGHTLTQEPLPRGSLPLKDLSLVIITMYLVCLNHAKDQRRIMHFYLMTYMATPQHKIPSLGVMKFTILVDHYLVIMTIYYVCLIFAWGDGRRFLNNAFLLNDLYGHAPAQEPCNGGHKTTIFIDSSHHYYIFSRCEPCPGVLKTIFEEINQFYIFYPKITSPLWWEFIQFTIPCLFTLQMLQTKFDLDWTNSPL